MLKLISIMFAETISSLVGCHKIEDVREVLVGLGLQVVRLVMSSTFSY